MIKTKSTYSPQFNKFLHDVESREFELNTTSKGEITIQQTPRNELRRQGIEALKADLEWLYGDEFDIVETKEGIIIVAENEPNDFTFSWELKSTIKATNYDPFIEAANYKDEVQSKRLKKELRVQEELKRQEELELKRAKKLSQLNQD